MLPSVGSFEELTFLCPFKKYCVTRRYLILYYEISQWGKFLGPFGFILNIYLSFYTAISQILLDFFYNQNNFFPYSMKFTFLDDPHPIRDNWVIRARVT